MIEPVIVIVAYRPKPGTESQTLDLVRSRVPTLREEGLVTDRTPAIMRARDRTIIEVSEWKSQEAIDAAPDPEQYRAEGEAAQLLGRMGYVEEVGRLCLFIASEATFTTGADHIISGGAELGYAQKSLNGKMSEGELVLTRP